MPDPLGSALANPLCMDSRLGNAQSYLARDVPAWVRAHLPVSTDARSWAVAGLSEGGTCSWQLAVNAPGTYPTFLDISGQAEPTLGSRARPIANAFGGDASAFDRVSPAAVLARQRLLGTTGIIVVGSEDGLYRPQARIVAELCRRAGHRGPLPGGGGRTRLAGLVQRPPDHPAPPGPAATTDLNTIRRDIRQARWRRHRSSRWPRRTGSRSAAAASAAGPGVRR